MKKIKSTIDKLCIIPLWDRCMLIIMAMLLLECAYVALFKDVGSAQDTSIDVVLRAAISSLFGYFLSANFLNSQRIKYKQPFTDFDIEDSSSISTFVPQPSQSDNIIPQQAQQIQDITPPPPDIDEDQNNEIRDCHWIMRIKIVTSMAIFSIAMLIIFRNISSLHNNVASFISMFANMTSGSLGYLIGYLPHSNNKID